MVNACSDPPLASAVFSIYLPRFFLLYIYSPVPLARVRLFPHIQFFLQMAHAGLCSLLFCPLLGVALRV